MSDTMTDSMTQTRPVGQLICLDRIRMVEPGRRAEAVRNVPSTLAIFDSHFPRFPVLPGVLILGSLAMLAELLLRESTEVRWRLAQAEKVSYRHFVQPGDVMELTVELAEATSERARCTARAVVDGRRVTTVGGLHLVPADLAGAR
jgi:3-hydroxyacyl-[acyl-carrier-protein] dehydratase